MSKENVFLQKEENGKKYYEMLVHDKKERDP